MYYNEDIFYDDILKEDLCYSIINSPISITSDAYLYCEDCINEYIDGNIDEDDLYYALVEDISLDETKLVNDPERIAKRLGIKPKEDEHGNLYYDINDINARLSAHRSKKIAVINALQNDIEKETDIKKKMELMHQHNTLSDRYKKK